MIEVMSNPRLFLQLNKELKEGAPLNYFGTILNYFKKASLIGGSVTLKQLLPIVKTDEEKGAPPFSEFIKQKLKIGKTPDDDLTASVEPSVQRGLPTTQVASRQPFLSGLKIAPAGGGGSSATSAPTDRSKYASLFPTDIVSSMVQPTVTMADGGEVPPREIDIKGQPHMLAYITPQEGGILQLLGGAGKPGPMGIPSFFADDDSDEASEVSEHSEDAAAGTGGPSSGDMGLDDSIADMANAMAGHTAGTTGYSNVQGSINYAPVQNVPYDFFGFVKGAMNRHARDSLSKGYSPEFSKDAQGNITSVTGRGGPGMSVPGIGGLMSMIGANMGAVTTTGYAGKGVDDMNDPNDNGNDNELIRRIQPITPQEEYRKAITIYNQNPNRYTLRTR
jgi:hypothetical protein